MLDSGFTVFKDYFICFKPNWQVSKPVFPGMAIPKLSLPLNGHRKTQTLCKNWLVRLIWNIPFNNISAMLSSCLYSCGTLIKNINLCHALILLHLEWPEINSVVLILSAIGLSFNPIALKISKTPLISGHSEFNLNYKQLCWRDVRHPIWLLRTWRSRAPSVHSFGGNCS